MNNKVKFVINLISGLNLLAVLAYSLFVIVKLVTDGIKSAVRKIQNRKNV